MAFLQLVVNNHLQKIKHPLGNCEAAILIWVCLKTSKILLVDHFLHRKKNMLGVYPSVSLSHMIIYIYIYIYNISISVYLSQYPNKSQEILLDPTKVPLIFH